MKLNYTVEVGKVDKNKIVYDGKRLYNTHVFGSSNLTFLNGSLTFKVVTRSGRIYGLSGEAGAAKAWQRGSVHLPQFIDGSLIFKPSHKLLPDVNYVFNKIAGIVYDETTNALLIGSASDAQLTVRIAQNLYVILNEREICGAIIYPLIYSDSLK